MSNAFQLLSNKKSFTVFAETKEEKNDWIISIQNSVRNFLLNHSEKTINEKIISTNTITEIAPVWVPDKLLKNCMICNSKFTTLNRRVCFFFIIFYLFVYLFVFYSLDLFVFLFNFIFYLFLFHFFLLIFICFIIYFIY